MDSGFFGFDKRFVTVGCSWGVPEVAKWLATSLTCVSEVANHLATSGMCTHVSS